MTDKIVPAASVQAPYYDDYDETKGYHRILFRPGYAVQGRELTQLQTILQKQVQRFGDSIYQNGSMVTGGEITYLGASDGVVSVNLQSSATASIFLNKLIVSQNTTSSFAPKAYVLTTAETSPTSEPPILILNPLSGSQFNNGDTINILNDLGNAAILASGTNPSSAVSINKGVYYYNGYFIFVPSQTIVLDKYDSTPTFRIGLQFTDTIIDEGADSSLLDPAQEASNYQAPGATRYQVQLVLSTRSMASTDDSNFIELMRVQNGVVTFQVNYPIYSELEKTLARRTFDESGSYTVSPFIGHLKDHQADLLTGTVSATASAGNAVFSGANTLFTTEAPLGTIITAGNYQGTVILVTNNTSVTANGTLAASIPAGSVATAQNPNKFTFKLSPGKAYVQGFEYETIAPTNLSVRRGRDTTSVSAYNFNQQIGNYMTVNGVEGLPDISAQEIYDFHSVQAANINFTSSGTYNATVIGNTRVRGFEYSSANTYLIYLYDSVINSNLSNISVANVRGLAMFGTAGNTFFNKRMTVAPASITGNNATITNTGFNTLVFNFPQSTIAAASITPASGGTPAYYIRRMVSNVAFTLGVGSFSLPTHADGSTEFFLSTGSDPNNLAHFTVAVRDTKGATFAANGDILPLQNAQGRSVSTTATTATINVNFQNTFTGDIVYSSYITAPVKRIKSPVVANTSNLMLSGGTVLSVNTTVFNTNNIVQVQLQGSAVLKAAGSSMPLYLADIYSLQKVLDFNGNNITYANLSSAIDITSSFILDNGQRDNYYDRGAIVLKAGVTPPVGPLVAYVNFYTHSGVGFLDNDSYPNAGTNAGYAAIPSYVSPATGKLYQLRDCIDWRPKKLNAANSTTLVDADTPDPYATTIIDPVSPTGFVASYAYYLGRVDKVVLTKDRQFKVIEGISSLLPEPPTQPATDMLLYTLIIPPFTFAASSVDVRYSDNRRYTMSDIGRIDKRLQNMEYYTALNLLEKAADSLVVRDNTGLNRFKNGILADNFTGHAIGDVSSYDYVCSIDFQNGILYPSFIANNINFNANSLPIHCDYGEADCNCRQDAASSNESCNPTSTYTGAGSLWINPDTATWHFRKARPITLVNVEGEYDNYEGLNFGIDVSDGQLNTGTPNPSISAPAAVTSANTTGNFGVKDERSVGFGTQFNDWQANWHGIPRRHVQVGLEQNFQGFRLGDQYTVSRTTPSTTTTQSSIPVENINQPQSIKVSINDNDRDDTIVPFVAGLDIWCVGTRLMPYTIVYPFFDEKPVQAYWMNANKIYIDGNSAAVNAVSFFPANNENVSTSSGGTGTVLLSPSLYSNANSTVTNVIQVVNMKGFWNIGDTITNSLGYKVNIANKLILTDNVAITNPDRTKLNIASSANNFSSTYYVNSLVNIAKGTGAGQISLITAYDNTNRVLTVSPSWNVAPDNTSVYSIGPAMTTGLGSVAGVIALPNDINLRFTKGVKVVRLTSSPTNDTSNVACRATAYFYADGQIDRKGHVHHRPRTPILPGDEINKANNPVSDVLTPNPIVRAPVPVITANNHVNTSQSGNFVVQHPPTLAPGLKPDAGGAFGGATTPTLLSGGGNKQFKVYVL